MVSGIDSVSRVSLFPYSTLLLSSLVFQRSLRPNPCARASRPECDPIPFMQGRNVTRERARVNRSGHGGANATLCLQTTPRGVCSD